MKIIIMILLAVLTVLPQNYKHVKLFFNSHYEIDRALSIGIDLEHSVSDGEGGVAVFVSENEFDAIVKSGLSYQVIIDDWHQYYDELPVMSGYSNFY